MSELARTRLLAPEKGASKPFLKIYRLQQSVQEICSELASEPANLLATDCEEGYFSGQKPNTLTAFEVLPFFAVGKLIFYPTRASRRVG